MKLWMVQMDCKFGDKEANLSKIVDYIDKAAEAQVQLIAFPELCLTGYALGQKFFELAEPIPGPSAKRIEKVARKHKIYVTLGMPELQSIYVYNSAPLFGPDGLVGVYKKLHLPTFVSPLGRFEEGMIFKGGDDIVTFDTMFGKLSIQICFDFLFPEITRAQALQGGLLILNLAAAPTPAEEKYHVVIRARAWENRAYYGFVNRAGSEEGLIWGGGSAIADDMGQIVKSASSATGGKGAKEEVVECEIDMEKLFKARVSPPYMKFVRPEIMLRAAEIAAGHRARW
ncbi:carbon-nitrogen hydrolase family protein [Chloroflexota bacterium]